MLRKITLFAILTACSFSLFAQKTWSLEEAITYARQNNLNVKQAQYDIRQAELTEKFNRMSRLPNVSARTSAGYQLGRTIDPTTNSFTENTSIGFNSYSVDAGATLFNGNAINNSIKQSKIDVQIAQLDAQTTSNDIGLQVASAYLNILLAQEQLENAQNRLEQSQRQLQQTDRLIDAGSLPLNDRLDFVAQIALDEQAIIEAQNSVNANYLLLKNLMVLDPNEDIVINAPEVVVPVETNPENFRFSEVYSTALSTQPQIQAQDLRIESARLDESIARAGTLPTLSIFGGLNTNYSSQAKDFANPNLENVTLQETTIPVLINGMESQFTTFQQVGIVFPNRSFTGQLSDNFGQSIGVSLSVPIYSNHRNNVAIERARLGVLSGEVLSQQTRNQLKNDVQLAIANARAARESYLAAQRSVEAAEAAFNNAQKRFDLGAINTLEFTTASNNLELARVNLIQAKYQYVFNMKVVDFYLGRAITLD